VDGVLPLNESNGQPTVFVVTTTYRDESFTARRRFSEFRMLAAHVKMELVSRWRQYQYNQQQRGDRGGGRGGDREDGDAGERKYSPVNPSAVDAIAKGVAAELPPRTWWCVEHSPIFLERRRLELQQFVDKGILSQGKVVYELMCVRGFLGLDGVDFERR
jgi:hypothetical protein